MATHYSDLYTTAAGQSADSAAARIYKGPHGLMSKGGIYVVTGSIVIATGETIGADGDAKFMAVPEGARLLRIAIVPSADLNSGNDFTFNLGWVSASNAFASASTGLQTSSAFTLAADAIITAAAAGADGDELVLTRVAGALSAGTLRFVAELSQG